VDFTLAETQQAVTDLAASVLRAEPDDGRTRAALAGEAGYDEATWKGMAQGLQLPPGYRIIGLPVTPSAAVGGALKAGDTVDVLAMDNPSKVAALADEPAPAPTMLGKNVLVIGLRTDQGASTESADHGLNSGSNRPSTVLLAIPQIDEATYSAAIAHSSFVLTLSTE